MSSHDDSFPDDLSGHFWARLVEMPEVNRWRYEVVDYQNNVMAQGVAVSTAQAARFVRASDAVACVGFRRKRRPESAVAGDPPLIRCGVRG